MITFRRRLTNGKSKYDRERESNVNFRIAY